MDEGNVFLKIMEGLISPATSASGANRHARKQAPEKKKDYDWNTDPKATKPDYETDHWTNIK